MGVRVFLFEKMRMRGGGGSETCLAISGWLLVTFWSVVCAYVLSVYFRDSNEAKERLAYDIRYQSQSICPIKIKAPCYFELP